MQDELRRVTSKDRLGAAQRFLTNGVEKFADGQFEQAGQHLRQAKSLSSRASCVRELLGLSAYFTEKWREAVAELRAFRRMTGDTVHMPVEMDSLRALGDREGVEKTWHRFLELGGPPPADSEARVVYGSFLLDEGQAEQAWSVVGAKQLHPNPAPHLLRRWFVAARVALALNEPQVATKLVESIRSQDPEMPGLEELSTEIAQAG